jgi:hypothetical protein
VQLLILCSFMEITSFLLSLHGLAGHLQVCSFGKATAVHCNAFQ